MKVLIVGASLRKESWNVRLASRLASGLAPRGVQVTVADYRTWAVAHYDGDVDVSGKPADVEALCAQVSAHDALVLVTPEYNFSYPGTLKNAIDWLSRYRPNPFAGRPVLLASASTGLVGGNRGLWALRQPLESLGAHVYPGMFSLAQAQNALDADGELVDAALRQRLDALLGDFADYARRLRS